ncbi:thioredoxin-like domain-containing protein [Demequina sp. SYSU T00192]|uniref:Thioredoxin-like domain-containing protein n=1 Tax=Demequina litoralis TaxID=3051660 RepID=A0ABT8G7K5_9MICO|nr:thioredoxin-like domain-containing protein [Demequina sp. SYSU T00192]MDN4475124.1 thioredoxin-like domain-containing protein [Demequina sp. SYSU T00192]
MRRATMLGATIGALVLAGCASGEAEGGDAAMSETPMESTAHATADAMEPVETPEPEVTVAEEASEPEPDSAFAFTAPTVMGGETFDGATLDDTDVILWFWAPWCPTCVAEAPVLLDAAERLPDGIEIVGLAGLSGDQSFMQEFVEMTGTESFTHVADLDGSVWRGFDVSSQATIIVVDDSGDAYTLGAGTTADELVDYAEKIAAT